MNDTRLQSTFCDRKHGPLDNCHAIAERGTAPNPPRCVRLCTLAWFSQERPRTSMLSQVFLIKLLGQAFGPVLRPVQVPFPACRFSRMRAVRLHETVRNVDQCQSHVRQFFFPRAFSTVVRGPSDEYNGIRAGSGRWLSPPRAPSQRRCWSCRRVVTFAMREWRPTSTRSSPKAEAAPCSQAARRAAAKGGWSRRHGQQRRRAGRTTEAREQICTHADLARERAMSRRKVTASGLHLPPVSMPSTTRRGGMQRGDPRTRPGDVGSGRKRQ